MRFHKCNFSDHFKMFLIMEGCTQHPGERGGSGTSACLAIPGQVAGAAMPPVAAVAYEKTSFRSFAAIHYTRKAVL